MAAAKSATQSTGVQGEEDSVRAQNLKDRDGEDDAKKRAEFEAAPIKGFTDLPEGHPMRARMEMMDSIEAANVLLEVGDEEGAAAATTAAIATAANALEAPPISAFTDPVKPKDAPVTKAEPAAKPKSEAATQVELQTQETPQVLEVADLGKYQVRVKIDGVEELVSATKALGTYQKGAAADVRLAAATKAQREAEAAKAEALKQTAAAPAATTTAPSKEDVALAQEKYKLAAEAMYAGEAEKSAQLFAEAVALTQQPVPAQRTESATVPEDLVAHVTAGVRQQLKQDSALTKLFEDYPDIHNKRGFQLIADEYANAFIANGDDVATAIFKAGEAIGEEYKLGKWAPQVAVTPPVNSGRPLNSGGPTTRAAKLSAKEELDNIQSGNARSTTTEPAEPTVLETLETMRNARPGQGDPTQQRTRAVA